jgi:peptide/nickel transport system permease protein
VKYGQWLGVLPGFTSPPPTAASPAAASRPAWTLADAPRFCGLLQGDWGTSTVFRAPVGEIIATRLGLTAKLMFWVMVLMVPSALLLGVLAGMREGSRLDRTLSTFSIATTATPEYVSGVIFITVFASSAFGLRWFSAPPPRRPRTRPSTTSSCRC